MAKKWSYLFENATPLHQYLGKVKKHLRELKGVVPKGFEATIRTIRLKPDPRKLAYARSANTILAGLLDYWLHIRAHHIEAAKIGVLKPTGSIPRIKDGKEEMLYFIDDARKLAATSINADCDDSVTSHIIKIVEATAEIGSYLD